jgi:hypothetical protein
MTFAKIFPETAETGFSPIVNYWLIGITLFVFYASWFSGVMGLEFWLLSG